MGEIIFSQKAQVQGMNKILNFLTHWRLHKLAKEHHGNGLPQLAIFSHDHIGHVINVEGRYEADYLNIVFSWMKTLSIKFENRVALDIGANIGNHTLFFSKFFNEVHALEPNPSTFELLRFNVSKINNVFAHQRGLSDVELVGTLRENPTNMGGTYVDLDAACEPSDEHVVKLSTLDNFVENSNFQDISLIKIDTEGFEARILRGATDVITKHRPIFIFELSPSDFDDDDKSDVIEILVGHGYHFISVERNFQFGYSWFGRALGFLTRIFLGERFVLRPINVFPPKYYQMIVALHDSVVSR